MTRRITSRDVDCPVCGARKGERCRGSAYSGRSTRTVDYHTARRTAARTAEPAGRAVHDDEYIRDNELEREGPHCVRCDDTGVVRYDGYGRRLPEDEPCPDCCGTTSA